MDVIEGLVERQIHGNDLQLNVSLKESEGKVTLRLLEFKLAQRNDTRAISRSREHSASNAAARAAIRL